MSRQDYSIAVNNKLVNYIVERRTSANATEAVVLLHGIMRTYHCMRPLAKQFHAKGHTVFNIDYASRKNSLEDIIQGLSKILDDISSSFEKVHFVTHSMGSLVLRGLALNFPLSNLGRVVMLGPPNQGSEVADKLQKWKLYQLFYGPAGQQLITDQTSLVNIIGNKVNFELGVIAGNRTVDPICSLFFLPGESDGKVTVASTKIPGMKSHIILSVSHSLMMYKKPVIQQTLKFIERGEFIE